MSNELIELLTSLKSELENDPRVLKLVDLDKKLNENEEVMKLAYKKDMASVTFDDALKHFGENSIEAKEALKKLHEAKYNLDVHPLVKEYQASYKEVRLLYEHISKELFGEFK